MNPWPFVIASYSIVIASTGALIAWAFVTMRRAEAALEQLQRK